MSIPPVLGLRKLTGEGRMLSPLHVIAMLALPPRSAHGCRRHRQREPHRDDTCQGTYLHIMPPARLSHIPIARDGSDDMDSIPDMSQFVKYILQFRFKPNCPICRLPL